MDKIKKILIISSDNNLKEVLSFCFDGWGYEVSLQGQPSVSLVQDLEAVKKASPDVIVVDVHSARKEQLDLCRILKDNFTTAFIPVITLINKRQLRTQLLSIKHGVDDYLIKPPDPLDLRIRIEMAVRRAQHSIHASSLTGLPGGRILEDLLIEKVKNNSSFSFCYLDIDNFKSFNDSYGYQMGDRVILQTAHMIFTVLGSLGNKDDFISHIGGDDFACITTPDKYEQICHHFIQMFDNIIPFHYSQDDRRQGFVITRDRNRKMRKMPLMSISVAVVSKDPAVSFKNIIEINEKVAEIKRYLKTIPESKFMADRRDIKGSGVSFPQVHDKDNQLDTYKPLGQILIEKNIVSSEQLDEALRLHWRKGVALGQILKDLGYLNDENLNKALGFQKINFSYASKN